MTQFHSSFAAHMRWFLFLVLSAPVWGQVSYTAPYSFSTLAGESSRGSSDGMGSAARFIQPTGVAVDFTGTVYVVDQGNDTVRKITPAGVVTTLAGFAGYSGNNDGTGNTARFNSPHGAVVDAAGNLYVTDSVNDTIRKITPSGLVTTLPGTDFFYPHGITIDSAGNLYAVDAGQFTIKKITPAGTVSTVPGSAGSFNVNYVIGSIGRPLSPFGIAVDLTGNVFVADINLGAIREITNTGTVATFASSLSPRGLVFDPLGNLYVGDRTAIRKITPAGVQSVLAGNPDSGGDADGPASTAQFNGISGIAFDPVGNLYVADQGNNIVRKVTPTGTVSTLAGLSLPRSKGSSDGTGGAARFEGRIGAAIVGPTGDLYLTDTINQTIRKISPTGVVSTIAGSVGVVGSADGTGSAAQFSTPEGMAIDSSGNLFVCDSFNATIRKITPAGVVTTFAGMAGSFGSGDGTTTAARFIHPEGIALDPTGNFYVLDGPTVRKISPAGAVTTLSDITYYTTSYHAIAIDRAGNVYLFSGDSIARITPQGVRTILAGVEYSSGGFVDGTGTAARFDNPYALAIDATGNVYVADGGGKTIRKISSSGVVSTLSGLTDAAGNTGGPQSKAYFPSLSAIATGAAGELYVTDGSKVLKGQLAGAPVISTQPLTQTVAPGSNVQFSVTAGGIPAPTYQWYFNGSAFSGATTNMLSFTNARSSDAGDYTVVVTNSLGSVTSTKATLTISSATATPPSTPATAAGGGAIESWFVLGVLAWGMASHRGRRGKQ